MIRWEDTFLDQVRAMRDEELLAAYVRSGGEAGDPAADAYAEELERRSLDF